jgi:hypothetical protein
MRRHAAFSSGLLLLALVAASCSKDDANNPGASATDGGAGAPPGDGSLAPCVDQPDLPRPPVGNQLPCDLLPPNFTR